MKAFKHTVLTLAIAGMVTACAGLQFGKLSDKEVAHMQETVSHVPDALRPLAARLYEEGERNAVLNFQTLGLKAMEQGEYALAERSLDAALRRIEAIYANNEHAKQAKSTWTEERVKDFKGEPYERAMAYYYRGLLYMRTGDYQNARASFLQADYQDTVSEREEFGGDFAVMSYLAGWSSMCDGDTARGEDLVRAALQKDPQLAAVPASSRFLALIDVGSGPIKMGNGKHKEVLSFAESPTGTDQVALPRQPAIHVAAGEEKLAAGLTDSRTLDAWSSSLSPLVRAGDLVYQATTRGGRPIQGILDGKAQFKDNAKAGGEAALAVGQSAMMAGIYSDNSDVAGMGAIASLIGMFAMAASEAAKPAADTRYWNNLPRDLYVVGGAIPPTDNMSVKLQVAPAAGGASEVVLQHWGKQGNCAVAWGRTRTGLDANYARKIETSSRPSDTKFRATLADVLRSGA